MPTLQSKSISIGIPDPPYGLNQNINKVKSRCRLASSTINTEFDWDSAPPTDEYFYELNRVTVNQIIWGANYFTAIVGEPFKAPRRRKYDEFIKQYPKGWIIWDKVNGKSDFSDCELAWTSFNFPTRIFYFMWAGMFQGVSWTDGLTMQGKKELNEKRIHPTQKPLPLYQWEFTEYTNRGDSLLDTHMGSQNSRIAAYKMGLDYYGTEIEEKYFKDGCDRCREHIAQPLFDR